MQNQYELPIAQQIYDFETEKIEQIYFVIANFVTNKHLHQKWINKSWLQNAHYILELIQVELQQRKSYEKLQQFFNADHQQYLKKIKSYEPLITSQKQFTKQLEKIVKFNFNLKQQKPVLFKYSRKIGDNKINLFIKNTLEKTKINDSNHVLIIGRPTFKKQQSYKKNQEKQLMEKSKKNSLKNITKQKNAHFPNIQRKLSARNKNNTISKVTISGNKIKNNLNFPLINSNNKFKFLNHIPNDRVKQKKNQFIEIYQNKINTQLVKEINQSNINFGLLKKQNQIKQQVKDQNKQAQTTQEQNKQTQTTQEQNKQSNQQNQSQNFIIQNNVQQNKNLKQQKKEFICQEHFLNQNQNQKKKEISNLQLQVYNYFKVERKRQKIFHQNIKNQIIQHKSNKVQNIHQIQQIRCQNKNKKIQFNLQKQMVKEITQQKNNNQINHNRQNRSSSIIMRIPKQQKQNYTKDNTQIKQQIVQKKQSIKIINKKITFKQKINKVFPEHIVDYSNIFPIFHYIFSAKYLNKNDKFDYINTLRQIQRTFLIHTQMIDNNLNLDTGFQINLFEFNRIENNYMSKPQQLYLYARKVGINFQQFIKHQYIFNDRLQNQTNKPKRQQIQYFRVIKTKQQVYDIITRGFYRTDNWVELPHGKNLKMSWNMLWTWSRPQIDFNKLIYFQKINHFNNNKNLVRKDILKKNINLIRNLGTKTYEIFDIIPLTFCLPKEFYKFTIHFFQQQEKTNPENNIWIMKPISKSRGRGITLINDLNQVIYNQSVVIQQYIRNPLLLQGYKFDMRIYVLLTSIQPLEAFIYKQGFARLTTQKYDQNKKDIKNQLVHLTNFSIQRHNQSNFNNSVGGSKISLIMLKQMLYSQGIEFQQIWVKTKQIILKSLIACKSRIQNNPNSFQLFGYDIIVDDNLRCWLLQVNSSPSLQREYLIDDLIKQQLVDDIIRLVNPINFNRKNLVQVLERRIMQQQGRKSLINVENNSNVQMNRDLNYILESRQIRRIGQLPEKIGNFEVLAPSEQSKKFQRMILSYKIKIGNN